MGERKGTNHYYPPDYDPKYGGLNKFMGTHALRERARKLHAGILIIRFEMPFNIWCDGCGNHIGMGVRYNAEKTKVGMYYSTPLYKFRMKCHLCDNHFEIKTDPANLTYVIETGARRQENRWDPTENEQVVPETKDVSHRLYDDAMYKLEHGVTDKQKSKSQDSRLNRLISTNESLWKDNYYANSLLRANFRMKKKEEQDRKKLSIFKNVGNPYASVKDHEDDTKLARILMQHKKGVKKTPISTVKRLVSMAKLKTRKKTDLSEVKKKQILVSTITSDKKTSESSTPSFSLVNYDSSSSEN